MPRIISKEVADTVNRILEEGVSGNGGAKNAYVAGYRVAAKTGTSQEIRQLGGHSVKINNGFLIAFAPYENPEVAMSIVVEHGGSGSELGAMAADVLSHYFSAKGTREELLTENTLIR